MKILNKRLDVLKITEVKGPTVSNPVIYQS